MLWNVKCNVALYQQKSLHWQQHGLQCVSQCGLMVKAWSGNTPSGEDPLSILVNFTAIIIITTLHFATIIIHYILWQIFFRYGSISTGVGHSVRH